MNKVLIVLVAGSVLSGIAAYAAVAKPTAAAVSAGAAPAPHR